MVKFKTFLLEAAGKGLTMFDVDETMFMTKAKVHVVKNGKVIKKLDNQQSIDPPLPKNPVYADSGLRYEGGSNYIEVIRKNGDLEKYSVVTGLTLEPEDVVRIHTGNGGGCGKPELRDKSLIEEDLLNEYITLDQAKKFYKYK